MHTKNILEIRKRAYAALFLLFPPGIRENTKPKIKPAHSLGVAPFYYRFARNDKTCSFSNTNRPFASACCATSALLAEGRTNTHNDQSLNTTPSSSQVKFPFHQLLPR